VSSPFADRQDASSAIAPTAQAVVRLGWMMLGLSVASGFVWLVVLASRLTGQSLQAAMAAESCTFRTEFDSAIADFTTDASADSNHATGQHRTSNSPAPLYLGL
jgi:hypothetical protein